MKVLVDRALLVAVDRALRHLPMHDDDCGSCDRIAHLTHEVADAIGPIDAPAELVDSDSEKLADCMSGEATCDGCGKQAPMVSGPYGWEKPEGWLQLVDLAKGVQDACSRQCAQVIDRRDLIGEV
jgi:hypothetical protein